MNDPNYKGFLVHEQGGGIQVYPANDSKEHKMSLSCSCYPTLRVNKGMTIVRHHPFDGRVITDEDKRMLGET